VKLIGLLGGTSWPSTLLAYRFINEAAQRRLGQDRSARVLLYSIDYQPIKSRYHDDWAGIPQLLKHEVETLLSLRPDCWMLANNTLHKAYDMFAPELAGNVPMAHAVHLVRAQLEIERARRVLLLGTRFTMEDGFFSKPLQNIGIQVEIPCEADRERVQAIQTRLARGEVDESFRAFFSALLQKHFARGCEAVVTACTELPLIVTNELTKMRLVDPLLLQAEACVDFATGASELLATDSLITVPVFHGEVHRDD
jgi:aspartate racemase